MKVVLKIVHNDVPQEYVMTVGHEVVLGRSSKADITLEDEKCSGKHCKFKLHPKKLEVHDLESKNGTFLNGIQIESSQVFIGDEVVLGGATVSLLESKFDEDAIDILTFPGPIEDKVDEELKLDFTGARIKNQQGNRKLNVIAKNTLEASHAQEVDLRKKFKSKIKVSKEIIRERHRGRTFFAFVFDFVISAALFAVPFILLFKFPHVPIPKEKKLLYLSCAELGIVGGFVLLNFKIMKFSIGERIAGIKRLYQKQ